jgi:hypothetical protein
MHSFEPRSLLLAIVSTKIDNEGNVLSHRVLWFHIICFEVQGEVFGELEIEGHVFLEVALEVEADSFLELGEGEEVDCALVDEEHLVHHEEVGDEDAEDALELVHTHPIQVDHLDQVLVGGRVESDGRVRLHYQPVDHLEDDVLHAGKVELPHCHFHSVLDLYPHMKLVHVVVLHSNN